MIRGELLDRLSAGSFARLTVVHAPAGWGKSTLLSAWFDLAGGAGRVAWFSVDRQDNDPVRFWGYIIEALQTVSPSVGTRSLSLLRVPGTSMDAHVLPSLINELAADDAPAALIIDDYHSVTSEEIHDGLSFFVRHLPTSLRLMVGSRTQPPLPLASLRARGELLELTLGDLRFSDAEASQLLATEVGVDMPSHHVQLLQSRTEGWVAGLHLAALSLRGHSDPGAFVERFAGDDRHILDYLSAEVLERQSPPLLEFLQRTAILERFCAPLCDAIVGRRNAAATLEQIERSQLFLIPLDTQRVWYRYHHIFGDLLRRELSRSDPSLVADLHRRATIWHRDHGHPADAVHHAMLAGDLDTAVTLILDHYDSYANRGEIETVVRWFEDLPPALMRRNGALCVARAFTGLYASDMYLADEWLQAAQRAQATGGHDPEDPSALEAAIGVGRASHRYFIGDLAQALSSAQRAAELLPDDGNPRLWIATGIVGAVIYWTGDLAQSRRLLARVAPSAEATGHNFVTIWSLTYLAELDLEIGAMDGAERSLAHAALVAERNGILEHYVCGPMQAARARLLWQQGRLDDASAASRHSVELVRRSPMRIERVSTLIRAARFLSEHGDRPRASEFLSEARRLLEGFPDPRRVVDVLVDAERVVAPSGASGYPANLTQREVAVLRLLAQGLTDARIARELFVSLRTVNAHVRSIYRKAGLNNRAAATRFAIDNDLL